MTDGSDDDEGWSSDWRPTVGYKKPPKHTRFKKGQSGNPKGRPRKRLTRRGILQEELSRYVTVVVGGKTRRMTCYQVTVARMVAGAMNGNARDREQLFHSMDKYGLMKDMGSEITKITVEVVEPKRQGETPGEPHRRHRVFSPEEYVQFGSGADLDPRRLADGAKEGAFISESE